MNEHLSLPIFPLGMPLFPGVKLDLQIFEQRYLKMIRDSMRESRPFVITALKKGTDSQSDVDFFDLGVIAEIVDWRQLENGLLGITVLGANRIFIQSSEQDDTGLWHGELKTLDDEPDMNIPDFAAGLVDVYDQLSAHASLQGRMPDSESLNASEFGWAIAQILPMSLGDRIEYLKTSDPIIRLDSLQKLLRSLADQG